MICERESVMKFSVLMSVYYKEKPEYLDTCLESIANQTLLPDEIVLVEDGPLTEELHNTIQNWKEKLSIIKSVVLKSNVGLAKALNTGLRKCSYNLVARMDTDDICVPDRFEKQFNFLKENPEIVLLGGQIAEYDEKMENIISYRKVPLMMKKIIKFSKKRSSFNHMTVVFKKDVIQNLCGYPEHLKNWQDFALWGRLLAKGHKAANLPDVVVKVRTGNNLFDRRSGLQYLKYELGALTYVFESGLINRFEYISTYLLKIVIRLLPRKVLKLIYRTLLRDK